MDEAHIIVDQQGSLGRLTLNRPRALNALTHEMCESVLAALSNWEADPAIHAVLIDAAPGRVFCAGGDVRAVYELGKAQDPRALDFFATEYRMIAAIAQLPKPIVSILDGITMGGGAGISVHGRYRVATENTVFAMPETAIGFFPDVGGSYFLSHCPGAIGMYLGLTGARIDGADMIYAGLATHWISAQLVAETVSRLVEGEPPETVLQKLSEVPKASELSRNRATIDRAFGASSVEEILERLSAEGPWGAEITALLRARSPTSLKLVYRQLTEGAKRDLTNCLEMELAITAKILEGHDFYEGVRAVLVDKDHAPNWQPDQIGQVDDQYIEGFFESPA